MCHGLNGLHVLVRPILMEYHHRVIRVLLYGIGVEHVCIEGRYKICDRLPLRAAVDMCSPPRKRRLTRDTTVQHICEDENGSSRLVWRIRRVEFPYARDRFIELVVRCLYLW